MPKKRIPIGERIRAEIERNKMTRYEICKRTGIDQAALSRFMADKKKGLSMDAIDRLLELFDLDIS